MKTGNKYAIIGAGVLGLTLALRLAQKGQQVTVLEKSKDFGGLAAGIPYGNSSIEKYYHHWFKSDIHIQKLVEELGLKDKLVWLPSKVGVYYQDKIYDFSTALSILKFSPLNFLQRLRLGIVSLLLQKNKNYKKFESITALEWCRKNFGGKVTDVIWEPLLKGKFGEYFDKISMSWLWARIYDRSSSRPNPLSKEYLGYLDGGFQLFINTLVERCKKTGVKLIAEAELQSHYYNGKVHTLEYVVDGKKIKEEFATVTATVPGPVFTKLFRVSDFLKAQINSIKYLGAMNMVLVLDQSVIPYYWLNVNDPSFPFLVLVEHTNFADKKNYADKVIVYVAKYLDIEDELYKKDQDQLLEIYTEYLKRINPDFDKSWIKEMYLFKAAYAQHIVLNNYQMPPYRTDIPGLYLANFSQIYPHDRGTNYAIEQADKMSGIILGNG